MTKVNLESEAEETVGATEEDILDVIENDDITAELVEASKEANDAAEADQELTGLAEEVTETIGDIEEKLEDTAEVVPEDVAVAQESLRHYKKMLGIKDEGTKISLESMRTDSKANLEGIKVELEGILDTIKDSAKKVWRWIIDILAKLGELIRSGFKHIQGIYRTIAWSDRTKEAKFYEEVMKEVSRKTKYVSPSVFYTLDYNLIKDIKDGFDGKSISYYTYVKSAADYIVDKIKSQDAFSDTIYSFYKPEELAEFYPKAIKLVSDTTTELMDNIQTLLGKIEKARPNEKLALDAFADKDEVAKSITTLFKETIEKLKGLNKRRVIFEGTSGNTADKTNGIVIPKTSTAFIDIKVDNSNIDSDDENASFMTKTLYAITEGGLEAMIKKNDTFVHDLDSLERAFTSCEKQYSDLSNDIASIERLAKSLDSKEQSLTSLLDKYSKELYLFKNAKIAVRSFVMLFNNLLIGYENYNSYLVKSIGKINKAADIPDTLK
jgi:hypothetical protein